MRAMAWASTRDWQLRRDDNRGGFVESDEEEQAIPPFAPTKTRSGLPNRIGWVLVAVFSPIMMCGVCATCTPDDDDRSDSAVEARLAYLQCQRIASKQLKAPSTATFAPFHELSVSTDGAESKIRFWVDSQNSYGALLRSNGDCWLSRTNGEWKASRVYIH